MSTGFAYKDLPLVLQCLSAGRGQGKTTCQRCLRRLNEGKRHGRGSWVRLVLWQNQSPVLGLAVKGSPYIVYMPVQPNGKFCPSDQKKTSVNLKFCRGYCWSPQGYNMIFHQVLLVTALHKGPFLR